MPSRTASERASSSASGEDPATAHPAPRNASAPAPWANACSGCMPKRSTPAWLSADRGVAPLVWPTNGAAPVTTSAAAAISESGTHSTIARQPPGTSPRPSGPVTSRPASLTARASAVPSLPAPTMPTRPSSSATLSLTAFISLPVHSTSGSGRPTKDIQGAGSSAPLPMLAAHASTQRRRAPRGPRRPIPPGVGVYPLPAGAGAAEGRVRQRQRERRPDVRGRGSRRTRGSSGSAVRRSGRKAARSAARGDRAGAPGCVRLQRTQVQAAREPRDQAAHPLAARLHGSARARAGARAGRTDRPRLPALSPGRGPALDRSARRPARRRRAYPGAAGRTGAGAAGRGRTGRGRPARRARAAAARPLRLGPAAPNGDPELERSRDRTGRRRARAPPGPGRRRARERRARQRQDDLRPRCGSSARSRGPGHEPDLHDRPRAARRGRCRSPRPLPGWSSRRRGPRPARGLPDGGPHRLRRVGGAGRAAVREGGGAGPAGAPRRGRSPDHDRGAVSILGIDTSTAASSACAVRDDGEAFEIAARPERLATGPAHARELMPAVADVMQRAGLAYEDLDAIAVGVGPGTFTGLRIGLATARALANTAGLTLRRVSSLAALAAGIEARRRLALIDAKRGELFAALYEDADELCAPFVASPEEVAARVRESGGRPLAAGDGSVRFREVLEDAGVRVAPDGSSAHVVRALHVCRLASGAPGEPPGVVVPDYLRAPDAKPQ